MEKNDKRTAEYWKERYHFGMKAEDMTILAARLFLCAESSGQWKDIPGERVIEDMFRHGVEPEYPIDTKGLNADKSGKYHTIADAEGGIATHWPQNMQEEGSLIEFYKCCLAFGWLYEYIYRHFDEERNGSRIGWIDGIAQKVINQSHECIGYWTAKAEEKSRNKRGGATAKEKQGQNHEGVIGKLLKELNISSLQSFRSKTDLRKDFLERVRASTDLTSENRIFFIARKILKNKATALDTKPPA
jgi:hypothetical protein